VTSAIFDGLTVLEETCDERGWRARLRVEATSRAFAGHFDGEPILPGVSLLAIVAHALRASGARLRALPSVRFRRPVRPGDVLEMTARREGDGWRFEATVEGTPAAAGTARDG
jgi:3-hydroxymyristoyl/3-hydroxydecanoyl-(acyl carrier protein) dehydratase